MHRQLERGRDEIDTARRRIDRAAPGKQHGESVQAAVQILMQRRDERGVPGGPTTFSSWSRRTKGPQTIKDESELIQRCRLNVWKPTDDLNIPKLSAAATLIPPRDDQLSTARRPETKSESDLDFVGELLVADDDLGVLEVTNIASDLAGLGGKGRSRAPLGRIARVGLGEHLVDLLERQTLGLWDEEVGVDKAASAESAPDEEDVRAKVALRIAKQEEPALAGRRSGRNG